MPRSKGVLDRILRGTLVPNTIKNILYLKTSLPNDKGCMEWQGAKRNGYGRFKYKRRNYNVHRVSFAIFHGPIPKGRVVMHKCDNRSCVRPTHLQLGTQQDNVRDMWSKKRARAMRGEINGMARLTARDVREIKRKLKKGYLCLDLADEYGMDITTISKINTEKLWRHIPWD